MWCDAGSDGAGGPVSRGRSSSAGTEGVRLSALRPGSSGTHPTAAAACGTLGPPGTVPSAVRPVSVHGGDGGIGSPGRWRFVSALFALCFPYHFLQAFYFLFPLFPFFCSCPFLSSFTSLSLFLAFLVPQAGAHGRTRRDSPRRCVARHPRGRREGCFAVYGS